MQQSPPRDVRGEGSSPRPPATPGRASNSAAAHSKGTSTQRARAFVNSHPVLVVLALVVVASFDGFEIVRGVGIA